MYGVVGKCLSDGVQAVVMEITAFTKWFTADRVIFRFHFLFLCRQVERRGDYNFQIESYCNLKQVTHTLPPYKKPYEILKYNFNRKQNRKYILLDDLQYPL